MDHVTILPPVELAEIFWRRDCRHGRYDRVKYRNRCQSCVAETIGMDRRRIFSAVLAIIESERANGHAIPGPDKRAQEIVLARVVTRTRQLQKEVST